MIARPASSPAISRSGGVSPAAESVIEGLGQEHLRLQQSLIFGQHAKGSVNELFRLVHECSVPNWDGQRAHPVSMRAADAARQFLEALPFGTPAPSVGADPDGDVTLEWYQSPRWTLSISISPNSDLHYAALLGASKAYGSEPFYGVVPSPILQLVHRVLAA